MDLTFALSAIIFTLLAIVVATSVFNGSSSANRFFGQRCGDGASKGSDQPKPKQNGHVPEEKTNKKKVEEDWCEISGSSHDHWDVVKSEEAYPKLQPEEHSSSTSSLSISRLDSRDISLDSSLEASSGRSCGSFFGLSDEELLKCAFSHPQNEGATESPGISDHMESTIDNNLRYIPGKARSHHLQMMMSKEELEEEQRVQREQLATIFQLLKDNKETFGEVSEGDMEEQLRLYSI